MEAIIASLETQGADAQQIAEVEETITPTESAAITKVIHMTKKYVQETVACLIALLCYHGLRSFIRKVLSGNQHVIRDLDHLFVRF